MIVFYQGIPATVEVMPDGAVLRLKRPLDGHSVLKLGRGWRELVAFAVDKARVKTGRTGRPRKVDEETRALIRRRYAQEPKATIRSLGRELGIHYNTIWHILYEKVRA